MCMCVLPAFMSVPSAPETGVGCHIPGTVVTGGSEQLYRCWELNLGTLEE